ncbi:hypothetical protein RN001_002745 [Aquatica leii]|uniref:peptidylprolyl isomerase n=1 Tax=Aquatica leii TaxID=1421715 RepID=A0AAN7Q5M3_9COLE|nr:hypothetical protein RN001_002745 [Aquatica leii]
MQSTKITAANIGRQLQQHSIVTPDSTHFLKEGVAGMKCENYDCPISIHYGQVNDIKKLSVYQLMMEFAYCDWDQTAGSFINFCKSSIPAEMIEQAEKLTSKKFNSLAMSRGRNLEHDVLCEVEKMLKCKGEKCGFTILKNFGIIGASPDGITKHAVIEVFFDIKINNDSLGRIEIGLFGEVVPKTVENFYQLCQKPLKEGYKGCIFHRVVNDFMIQSGDFIEGDGTKGRSIYGDWFEDENFKLRHYGAGWVSMANAGKNTNNSQFFITLKQTAWLNEKHVVFGKVLNGMNVVKKIGATKTDQNERPLVDVVIDNCTVEKVDKPFHVSMEDAE